MDWRPSLACNLAPLERQTCSGKEDNAFTGDLKDYDDENLNDLKDTLDTTYRMKGNPEEETR